LAVLRVKNPDLTKQERTWLTAQYTTGTSLSVQNTEVWADNNIAVVGNPGEEKTEATDLTATPPDLTTLTVTALNFTHNKDTVVYKSKWDQVEISSKPSGGSYSILTTIDLQWDKPETLYDDTTGLTTDTYKFRFKNSQTTTYSAYSDELLASGYGRDAVFTMATNIRRKVRDLDAKVFTDDEIIDALDTQQSNIEADHPRAWFLRKTGTAIPTVASTSTYNTPTDLNYWDKLQFNYVNGNTDVTYNLHHVTNAEMDALKEDNNATDRDELRSWTERPPTTSVTNGQFQVHPTPESANLNLTPIYWQKFSTLNSMGDTTELPDPEILENLVARELEFRQGNTDRATVWGQSAIEGIRRLFAKNRRQRGEPGFLKFIGQKGARNLFGQGTRNIITDADRENYF